MPKLEIPISEQAINLLTKHYGKGPEPQTLSVPGRVNLIGEHIDYHNLPVLPMAIQRHVSIAYRVRTDGRVRAVSMAEATDRQFVLSPRLEPAREGDWVNYLLAAAVAVQTRWPLLRGIDAAVASDLPIAAGLSSSSALLAGFAIALLRANEIDPTIEELMDVLPEGEHFVGTRGGGMDHAAVLAARRECALLIDFAPLALRHVRIPPDWAFLVAHSLTTAEKSGAMRLKYNALREEGVAALRTLEVNSSMQRLRVARPDRERVLSGAGSARCTFMSRPRPCAFTRPSMLLSRAIFPALANYSWRRTRVCGITSASVRPISMLLSRPRWIRGL